MNRQPENVDLTRRAVMLLGLAGASALVLSKGRSALAQEPKGVEVRVIKEAASRIQGVPKVRLLAATLQPGAALPKTKMDNSMICECTLGSLEVTLDDRTATMKTGDIWTCGVGTIEGVANKGKTAAIMRVFVLLPA